jgi:hypothetical protein
MTLEPSQSIMSGEKAIGTCKHTDTDSHHDWKEIATHFREFKSRALEVEMSKEVKWDSEMQSVIALISGASPNCSLIERVYQPQHVESNTTALGSLELYDILSVFFPRHDSMTP